MPSVAGRVIRGVAGLIVGLAIAGGVAYREGIRPTQVMHYIEGVPPEIIAGCAGSAFIVLAFQSLRWHLVMSPMLGLTYGLAYRAQVVGQLFNAFLPARAGDLLRVQYLGRRTGKSRATILGTELVDRWLDWWGWIPILLTLAVVSDVPGWLYKALGMFGALLFGMGTTMVVLTRRGWTPKPGTRLASVWASFRMGIGSFQSRRMLGIALAVAPLPWVWEVLALMVVGRGFGITLTPGMAFSALIGFNLATVVPSPGGLGTVEAGGAKALILFGVEADRAIAFILVYHLCQLLPSIVTGAFILAAEGEKLFGKGAPTASSTPPRD